MNPLLDLIQRAADLSSLSDDELVELLAELQAEVAAQAAGDLTDEALDALDAAATAAQSIRDEQAARADKATQRAERAAAALAAVNGPEDEDEDEDDENGDEESESTEGEGEESSVETIDDEPVVEQPAAEEVPVAAASTPKVTSVRARRPAATRPKALVANPLAGDISTWGLVASANCPTVTPGTPIRTRDQLAAAFVKAYEQSQGYRQGATTRVSLVTASIGRYDDPRQPALRMYGDDRFLDRNVSENTRKIERVTSPQAIAASGGICAPINTSYDLPVVGSQARPVRDQMLARFGADRGGVATIPPPLITELEDAISVWTEANDQTPSDPTTKPCLTVTCPEEDETLVEAIVRCIKTGNFRARFFPEQLEAWMRLAGVNWARLAEQRLLATIAAGSTNVTSGQILGASRDILTTLDRAVARMQQFHRDPDMRLRLGLPFWTRNLMRADLTRAIPFGTAEESLAIADAQLDAFFAARGVNVTYLLDGETAPGGGVPSQQFNGQGDGPLVGWPNIVRGYLYPEGSWLFLDGGTLDLGMVRDSTLNHTNDFEMFAESFEGAHFHGVDSETLDMDVCPDGSTSLGIDIAPCTVGS